MSSKYKDKEERGVILAADMKRHNAIKLEEKAKRELAAAQEYSQALVKRMYEKLPVTEPLLFAISDTVDANIVTACLKEWGYNVSDGRAIQNTKHIFIDIMNPMMSGSKEKEDLNTGPVRAEEMKRCNIQKQAEKHEAQKVASLASAQKIVQQLYERLPVPMHQPQRFWFSSIDATYDLVAAHLTSWGYIVAACAQEPYLLSISFPV